MSSQCEATIYGHYNNARCPERATNVITFTYLLSDAPDRTEAVCDSHAREYEDWARAIGTVQILASTPFEVNS